MTGKITEKILDGKHQSDIGSHIGQVYIAFPESYSRDSFYPLIIALHGSGREALSYRDVPFYAKQRDIALECGYVFAAVSNGPATYGLDEGYRNVIELYEYMQKNYLLYKKTALWASSAGGFMMHRLYRDKSDIFGLLLGTFTVFDPLTIEPIPSMLSAFGAKDTAEFREKAGFLSPAMFKKDIYKNSQIVIAHGEDDEAVPISQSEQLLEQVKNFGGRMELVRKPGGHSTQNFALFDTDSFKKALLDYRSS